MNTTSVIRRAVLATVTGLVVVLGAAPASAAPSTAVAGRSFGWEVSPLCSPAGRC